MFQFEEPAYLYLLLLLPLLVVIYIYAQYRKRKAIRIFGDPLLLKTLMPEVSHYRPGIKFGILLVVIGLFSVLLARPQFGSRLETVKRQGVEVIIALDISNSMMAEDVKPNRLEKAKRLVSQLVDKLDNDKVSDISLTVETTSLPKVLQAGKRKPPDNPGAERHSRGAGCSAFSCPLSSRLSLSAPDFHRFPFYPCLRKALKALVYLRL